ncbi:hypothetical protein [Rhizobium sp. 10PS4]|uniref:hypothetical protein n=1 Tax=Rhizobium sp. 10PS4 TaxID=3075621 RepID=UPI0028FD58A4|nr:hypothetical protein [Rhizobium sp. 10PS4]MDU0310307.1 hypothetical protein [Rhizobium sp. 10PS4]
MANVLAAFRKAKTPICKAGIYFEPETMPRQLAKHRGFPVQLGIFPAVRAADLRHYRSSCSSSLTGRWGILFAD